MRDNVGQGTISGTIFNKLILLENLKKISQKRKEKVYDEDARLLSEKGNKDENTLL